MKLPHRYRLFLASCLLFAWVAGPLLAADASLAARERRIRERLAGPAPEVAAWNDLFYLAQQSDAVHARELGEEILKARRLPDGLGHRVEALLAQSKLIGKPVRLKGHTTAGEKIDLAQLKGRVIVLDFWAVWCKPCIAEMPKLMEFYRRYRERGVTIIGVSLDDNDAQPRAFARKAELPWPIFCDEGGFRDGIGGRSSIQSIPTVWIIDQQGRLRDVNGRARLAEKVEALLKESAP